MPSITTWTRLEPNTRTNDLSLGMQARVHDPLWMLTRQWQFGEFGGEDAGSPIQARLRASSNALLRYHPGRPGPRAAEQSTRFPKDTPLEVIVESERVLAQGGDVRTRVEMGLLFLKMLSRARLARHRQTFVDVFGFDASTLPAEIDPGSRGFAALANRRAPDAASLARALRSWISSGDLPEGLSIDADDRDAVRTVGESWLEVVKSFVDEPSRNTEAWNHERFEYSFAVSTNLSGAEVVLVADEYQEGHLDWYGFSARSDVSLGGEGDEADKIVRTVIPTPVTFKGMPASRWWEFEDARVDLGSLSASGGDLTHMLLAQFALLYGNDWYVIPIDLPVGTLSHVDSLVVTDTFGVRSLVRRTGRDDTSSAWQAFTITNDGGSNVDIDNCLLLAPALAGRLDARPNEQVWLVRDEGANTAWGIEGIIESLSGRPIQRGEEPLWQARASFTSSGSGDADLIYKLATEVPDHWIALVPVRTEGADGRSVHFERADLIQPEGKLLEPDRTLRIPEEEIPRSGARVERGYQFARWHGGRSHLWMGRRKITGRGEASSGLRFDATVKAPTRD